jgi:NosR/NirI family transcriptional regulator, nitrous oxide reductase regulator
LNRGFRGVPIHFQGSSEQLRRFCIVLLALVFTSPAFAEKGKLRERLTPTVMAVVYPGAERLGVEEGSPPAIAVYKDDKIVAWIFSTLDIIAAPGYTSTPFDVIAGIDLSGHITGAKVVFHNEPHIVGDPMRQRELDTFLARQAGRALRGGTDPLPPDYVADTTVSARAMRTAVLATAAMVLRSRASRRTAALPAGDAGSFKLKSVDELLAEGALVKRRVTSGEIAAALAKQNATGAKLDWPLGKEDEVYIEFATALVTPAAIGGNLLGVVALEEYKNKLPAGAEAIYVASNGPYNFLGTKYYESATGNRFDRLRVVQGGKIFHFTESDYTYAVPIKGQEVAGLFALTTHSGFDASKPWRVEILVNGAGDHPVTVPFGLDYKLPANLPNSVDAPPAASDAGSAAPAADVTAAQPELDLDLDRDLLSPVPAWVEAWGDAKLNIALLTVLLSVLTAIFLFQARLARSRVAHRFVRNGFLLIVVVWLGWTAGAQLSTVHVINYMTAPFHHLDAGFYLAEPLIVIIAGYTLVSVLLIGRGVFCGWLCPFGALQELLGQLSRALGVPQWAPPVALEKRLWAGKYIAAAAVLLLVITQIDSSGAALEIEPFKTAITSKFTRAWPFIFYAAALLAIGLFSERAYCRFLCPLGGLLAALDRLHLLNVLKRRPECGSPCHLCERACPVRAISPTGKINTAECFQCLDCQVEYYDDKRCPPLVQAAKLRGKAKPVAPAMKHV